MADKSEIAVEVDLEKVKQIVDEYSQQRWALIPLVQRIQNEVGFIPPQSIPIIAKGLGLFPSQVQGVISFYEQLYTEPRGRQVVRVCRGTACHVRGGARILREVEKRLGIKPGQTTDDLEYSLETIACFGSCALAPVIVVDQNVYGRMTAAKVREILSNK